MQYIVAQTKTIMLVTGAITCTMVYAVLFPYAALESMFGETLPEHVLADIIVRSWGTLVTLVGAMLIYGAYVPHVRPLVLFIAGTSKLAFVGLLLFFGSRYLPQIATLITVDAIAIVLFAICLPSACRR